MQRIVEIGLPNFFWGIKESQLGNAIGTSNKAPLHLTSRSFNVFCTLGIVSTTLKQWISNQLSFVLHWSFCLCAILTITRSAKNVRRAVLVYGVGEESIYVDNSDVEFADYCKFGPIEPLKTDSPKLVQSNSPPPSSSSGLIYCKHPLAHLMKRSPISPKWRVASLIRHCVIFARYLVASLRQPALSIIAKDFAYTAIASSLDRAGLIESVVVTQGYFKSQPLWLRSTVHAKIHMVWYSQAAKQIVFKCDPLDVPIPNYKWLHADIHWVWTQKFADYLRGIVKDIDARPVGPIVWRIPDIQTPAKNQIRISIFDVSPYSDDTAIECGEIPNYNCRDNLIKFVTTAISLKLPIESTFGLPVTFHLKTKRGYRAAYDRQYFEFLDKLNADNLIRLEHFAINAFSLISQSHLVIAYPFTSPAYIAEHLSIPAIYFDPTDSIMPDHFGDSPSLIKFANNQHALFTTAASALDSFFHEQRRILFIEKSD